MAHQTVQPILVHFGTLFTFCKLLGLYPYDLQAFRSVHVLQSSKIGTVIVIATMFAVVVFYNSLIYFFSGEDHNLKNSQSE